MSLAVAGCGGGGGGGSTGTGPGTTNTPPSFTSAATATVVENATGTIHTATATDAQGSAIVFSISGGADAARFAITAAGALSFVTPPNFDLASDANGDNVYEVTLAASDGSASATQSLMVTVTNSREGVQVRRVATGLNQAVSVSVVDANRALVGEADGGVTLIDTAANTRTALLSSKPAGLVAVARDRDFSTSGVFYTMNFRNDLIFITRYRPFGAGYAAFASETFPAPGFAGGGWLSVDDSGVLFVGIPDGSPSAAQASGGVLGKLLSLTPVADPYAGASINHFTVRTVAQGFREPVGGGFLNGRILLADRGASVRDEIDLIDPTIGGNFGWPFKEGSQTISAGAPAGLTDPVVEYARGTGMRDGQGVAGLVAYRGAIASLTGTALIFDRSGRIFAIAAARLATGTTLAAGVLEVRSADFAPDVGTIDQTRSVATDAGGTIFILDGDGELYRLSADGT